MRPTLQLLCCLIAIVVASAAPAAAQDTGGTSTQMSVGYEYRRGVTDKLRGFGNIIYEKLYDANRLFGAANQLSSSGGVSYDLSKRIRIEGGLGLYYNYFPDITDTFETRLWQAITLDWPNSLGLVRRYVLSHRFRLEERFKNIDSWDFALRLRYRLKFAIAINRYTVEPGAFYVPLRAEWYFPLGDDVEQFFAKKARYTVGLGYVMNKSWTIELRYARQQLREVDTSYKTTDQFIELRVKSSFRILDLLKGR